MTASTLPSPASVRLSASGNRAGSAVRAVIAAGLAAGVTLGLFMAMQALIAFDAPPVAEAAEPLEVQIAFNPPELAGDREPRLPRVDPVAPPPAPPVIDTRVEPQPVEGGFPIAPPVIETSSVMSGMERIALPPPPLDRRVEPTYPRSELSRGIQGDCTVRYDILASGRTANLSIAACDSAGFQRASLDAVGSWSYAAASEADPNTVVRRGVMTTLSFRLQD